MNIKHKKQPVMSPERNCANCIHAHRLDEMTLECDAEVFDTKFLSCFVARENTDN